MFGETTTSPLGFITPGNPIPIVRISEELIKISLICSFIKFKMKSPSLLTGIFIIFSKINSFEELITPNFKFVPPTSTPK